MELSDAETKRRISYHYRRLCGELSYNEVARRAGTYPSAIKDVADGVRMPGVGTLSRIAHALGSTVNEMIRPIPEKISA